MEQRRRQLLQALSKADAELSFDFWLFQQEERGLSNLDLSWSLQELGAKRQRSVLPMGFKRDADCLLLLFSPD